MSSSDNPLEYHDRWALFGSLPLFIGSEADRRIYYNRAGRIRLPVRLVTYIFCSLPTLALFACVFLALETDFELATRTHCGVQNLLPSVSVAVGDFHWGNLLWKSAIFTHLPPRICVAFVYAQLFRVPFERCGQQTLRYATCVTNLIELFSLGLLSAVTSEHNHPLHVFAFTTFQISAIVHMMLHTWMYDICRLNTASKICRQSYRYKRRFLRFSFFLLIACSFIYYWHNARCEPYVYSLFALCEYLLVVMNILFHGTVMYDFDRCYVYIF
ncbi:Post-GPI attachment to proteins factor 2 [Toxocara canis]|uniref:Post-GPI attachment to proteins factor 2 n=1 Tax=Toxocara canis TaxID=6265 RepID=A0A0B2VZ92_TOXCA|nr:Post-GPI attachment to proteins factor 2 [Toxocara canis]